MDSFHEMQYVYEVYRQQSFTRAAEALYISQSSLSLMVKKAEKRIGGAIFDRSTLPITLTETGKAYIRAATQIMAIEEGFREEVGGIARCASGRLALGGTTLFTSYVLSPLLSAFSAQYPGVDVQLHESHTAVLQQELLDGTLDLVVDNGEFDPALFSQTVFIEEELLLAIPRQNPLNAALTDYCLPPEALRQSPLPAAPPPVPMAALSQEDFLLLREGNDTRARAERLFTQAGFRPRVRLLTDHQIVCCNLAAYGMGCTFVSQTLARRGAFAERLCFYRLPPDIARRNVSLFSRRNRRPTPPMRAFIDMLPQFREE